MKLCKSHNNYKSILDAKFESSSSFSFGNKTSQSFLGRREQVTRFGYLLPENGFNFQKMSFYAQYRSSRPKIDPHVNFSNLQAQENVSFCKFLGRNNKKRAAANPPDRSILLKFGQNVHSRWRYRRPCFCDMDQTEMK